MSPADAPAEAELELGAPAKLNLVLRVGARRDDGFHELATCMLALDRRDRLRMRRVPAIPGRPPVRFFVHGPQASADVPADAENLAARAARLVLEGAPGAALELELEKHVPSGAGLGGGSADAAAALFGAARLLGLDPAARHLEEGLARLGSDCPFFLAARDTGWAVCLGRGERVEQLAPPPAFGGDREPAFVVLTPRTSVSTAAVYAALAAERARGELPLPGTLPEVRPPAGWLAGSPEAARAWLANDLEPAACAAEPGLARWRAFLDEHAPHFVLAGSGASFFGLYAGARDANEALGLLRRAADEVGLALRAAFVAGPAGPDLFRAPAQASGDGGKTG